jgi:hypothetical protein
LAFREKKDIHKIMSLQDVHKEVWRPRL